MTKVFVKLAKIVARNEHFQRSFCKTFLHFTKAHRQEASQLHVPTDTQTVRVPLVWLFKSWMPGITTLGSVVASGAGYASHALDPPSAVLQRPQPASYDRHRASYCADPTRFLEWCVRNGRRATKYFQPRVYIKSLFETVIRRVCRSCCLLLSDYRGGSTRQQSLVH